MAFLGGLIDYCDREAFLWLLHRQNDSGPSNFPASYTLHEKEKARNVASRRLTFEGQIWRVEGDALS